METITAQDVKRFAVRARKINLLTDAQKKLREELVGALLKGATLPTDGPYVIDLSQNGGKQLDWQEEYEKILIIRYRNKGHSRLAAKALAEKKMKRMKDESPDKEGPTIHGKVYAGGVKLLPRINEKPAKEAA